MKICIDCGISEEKIDFVGNRCKNCRRKRQSFLAAERKKEDYKKRAYTKREKKKCAKALDEMALRARAEGISYGKLMARMYLEEEKRKNDG